MIRFVVEPEPSGLEQQVLDLQASVLGEARFERSAFSVRASATCPSECGHVAYIKRMRGRSDDSAATATDTMMNSLIGSIRFCAVRIGTHDACGAVDWLLGPLVVKEAFAGNGVGSQLIDVGMRCISAKHSGTVFLVGDLEYYHRFGFERVPAGEIQMPGHVDTRRILFRNIAHTPPARRTGYMIAL